MSANKNSGMLNNCAGDASVLSTVYQQLCSWSKVTVIIVWGSSTCTAEFQDMLCLVRTWVPVVPALGTKALASGHLTLLEVVASSRHTWSSTSHDNNCCAPHSRKLRTPLGPATQADSLS